jgi:dTDP-4-amino-4,6-dideoxy-D-galactose acyltransferase
MSLELINARKNELFFYSPYNFIREIDRNILLKLEEQKIIDKIIQNEFVKFEIEGSEVIFVYENLKWDTTFFKIETYKIVNVLFDTSNLEILIKGVELFSNHFKKNQSVYIFIEIPSEDIFLIQALNSSKFKLIETRLTYFNDNILNYNYQTRYNVRTAVERDIENLKAIASTMRNNFDRFHADKTFDLQIADSFLSKYVEEAIKGFCDIVIVPNEDGINSDSFLTANFYENMWQLLDKKVSKMVLSAVSSQTNKGWYIKLISEMIYVMKEKGVECVYLNTQSTNRQVFRTWEKLGFRLGSTTHILSITI